MVRRWLIRSFFIALCVVCVGAWVGSYFAQVGVAKVGRDHDRRFLLGSGSFIFIDIIHPAYSPSAWRWDYAPPRRNLGPDNPNEHSFVGFVYLPLSAVGFGLDAWAVGVPMWCPTLVCALVLWLVWRKTRPKYAGRAFPVEPAEISAKTS